MSPTSYHCSTPRQYYFILLDIITEKMEEVEGFEPPRGLTRLLVFKTNPFSRTWVYLHESFNLLVDLTGLEPVTGRL